MKRKIYLALALVAILLPFEDFLLKWIPVSDQLFPFVRTFSELFLYTLWGILFLARVASKKLPVTPLDPLLIILLSVAAISAIINNSATVSAILTTRTFLRYIVVYYIVVYANLSWREVRPILAILLFGGLIQATIAVAQLVGGETLVAFFRPRLARVDFGDLTYSTTSMALNIGAGIGTIGRPAGLALFLMEAAIIALVGHHVVLKKPRRWKQYGTFFLLLLGIVASYKRGPLLVAAVGVPAFAVLLDRRRSALWLCCGLLVVAALSLPFMPNRTAASGYVSAKDVAMNPIEHLLQLGQGSYWKHTAAASRGWLISEVGPAVLLSGGLVGFGPDEVRSKVNVAKSDPTVQRVADYGPFEDVYWLALLTYYGAVGLGVFLLMLRRMYGMASWLRREGEPLRTLGTVMAILIMLSIPVAFLERTFEYRQYAFFFWLLGGLVASRYIRRRREWRGYEGRGGAGGFAPGGAGTAGDRPG